MSESFIRYAGWSAYLNGVLMIAIIVTLILLYTAGGIWGKINDGISVVWMLSFIPMALALFQMHRSVNGALSLVAVLMSIAAMLAFAAFQLALVLGRVDFDQTIGAIMMLSGVIGLGLLLNALMARAGGTLPSGLLWLFVACGLGYLVAAAGFRLGGQLHPLALAGSLVGLFSEPLLAFWLGRVLRNG